MGKKTWAWAATLAALVGSAMYFGSPFLAMQSLKSAAEAHDAERLERVIDFPSVRESLKGQLNALAARKFSDSPELKGNPFAGLAMMIVPAMVDKAVDGYVTADGIAALIERARAQSSDARGSTVPGHGDTAVASYSYGFKDIDTFDVTSTSKTDRNARVDFIFRRVGVFEWRLVRIGLPTDVLS